MERERLCNPVDIDKVTLRMFVSLAIRFGDGRCEDPDCEGELESVWIGSEVDSEEPIIDFIRCTVCGTQYRLMIAFVGVDLPKGL